MSRPAMVILRGNKAAAGTFPDENGSKPAWPVGALHVDAAREYGSRRGYDPVVLDIPGNPQGETSPQAKAAIKKFVDDPSVSAFYGFSGGGYNLRHILISLATNHPDQLHRIGLVVVLGAPDRPEFEFASSKYNALARNSAHGRSWEAANWELVYKKDPARSALPSSVPGGLETHMFGPDVLLAELPPDRQAVPAHSVA